MADPTEILTEKTEVTRGKIEAIAPGIEVIETVVYVR